MPPDAATGFLPAHGTRVFAHRGLALDAPENTLLSFHRALAAGATHLETDVHASLDGVAVVSHDADIGRLTGRSVPIDRLTMSELRRVDVGGGEGFVSLAEALETFPTARFNIDVKVERAALPTARAVLAAKATERVLVTSFTERNRARTVALLPGVATSPSARVFARAVVAERLGMKAVLRRTLGRYCAVQVPEQVRFLRIVTRRFVRSMHDAGVEVHVWTVNDVDDMARLLDLGVDGLVTDRADLAVALVARRA